METKQVARQATNLPESREAVSGVLQTIIPYTTSRTDAGCTPTR
jgi:hypothetical protein